MSILQLFNLMLALYLISAVIALALGGLGRCAARLAATGGILAGLCGSVAAASLLLQASPLSPSTLLFGSVPLLFSPLNSLMLLLTSLLSLLCALYAFGTTPHAGGKAACHAGLMNLLSAAISLLVVCNDAPTFMVMLELMSLSAALLVWLGGNAKARRAAGLYWLMSRLGSLALLLCFWLLWRASGTLVLSEFHLALLSHGQQAAILLLGLLGFGIVTGLVPLHGWIPELHANAPAPAAALFASVMLKIGLFGLLKLSIDWLGVPPLWWGLLLLIVGAVTAFIGGLYALAEHDLRRLLAYHTIENSGIILLGLAACVIGFSLGNPLLAVMGLLAGLFHLINHTLFKGGLFFGAGAVMHATGLHDIDKMGGLLRRMPLTGLLMLLALMSMAALPPLNGFVSEWYTYQSLFSLSQQSPGALRLLAPLAMVALAITGALAVMCVAKIFAMTFLGAARSEAAANPGRTPWSLLLPALLLSLACVLFGVGAPWIVPALLHLCANTLQLVMGNDALTMGAIMSPGSSNMTLLSPPLIALLLLAFPLLPLLLSALYRSSRLPARRHGDAWTCGYGHEPGMVVTAGGFAQPLRVLFAPLFTLRRLCNPAPLCGGLLSEGALRVYPVLALCEMALLLVAVFS
ncbi:proton-conducting transporter transmembrane domain-containing protein [Edwardsiella tarda]|uniref:Formate hydrogenlyase n=2 Tax=Edwardsiella tarda TaxID=636 RepID=A0A2A7TZW5_EDWTA|nr:proton-conducting transporter membrane subunit [Edwardsiella tarda]AKH88105.1 formate hydrogenlyase [Edwardsiella tarda]PEH71696.1 formate hydrogenlyase [Edwardsiella tarda]UCQ11867.1 formate hydrogenlyase [Edwardsiella tarda]